MHNVTATAGQSTKTNKQIYQEKYAEGAEARELWVLKDNVIKGEFQPRHPWKIELGRRAYEGGINSTDRGIRKKQSEYMSYALYWGWEGQASIRPAYLRGHAMVDAHKEDSTFQQMSLHEQDAVIQDCFEKAAWTPGKALCLDFHQANDERHDEAYDKIEEVYLSYIEEHGEKPSRNKLSQLAGSSRTTVSKFLREAERADVAIEIEHTSYNLEQQDSTCDLELSASSAQEEQWSKALSSLEIRDLTISRKGLSALPADLRAPLEANGALLTEYTWFLVHLREQRTFLKASTPPAVPPSTCRCRNCGDDIYFLSNQIGKKYPVNVAAGIIYTDIFDKMKHEHHLKTCKGIEYSLCS